MRRRLDDGGGREGRRRHTKYSFAGAIGQQFIVTSALPRFLTFLVATVVHAAVFMGLYVLLGLRSFPSPWTAILSQAVGNAAVGMIAFTVLESLPGVAERRRAKRRM